MLKIDFCSYLAWCREENIMFSSKRTHMFDYFICYHLESGWHVTRLSQGLSLGRRTWERGWYWNSTKGRKTTVFNSSISLHFRALFNLKTRTYYFCWLSDLISLCIMHCSLVWVWAIWYLEILRAIACQCEMCLLFVERSACLSFQTSLSCTDESSNAGTVYCLQIECTEMHKLSKLLKIAKQRPLKVTQCFRQSGSQG